LRRNITNDKPTIVEAAMSVDPYRNIAGVYDRFFEPINRVVRQIALNMYPPKRGMHVLDVGCGTGLNLELYSQAGCETWGIDLSPSMLDVARERLGRHANLYAGDATDMPYTDRFFDLVTAMLTIHEMSEKIRQEVLCEMVRVVKPGGHLIITDFHPGPINFPKGCLKKILISLFELAAGSDHYRNYRAFLAGGGVPGVVAGDNMALERKKIVGGGNIGLFLIRTG
jgi:ubiquinone/menaquinone biosynthesis C-methylase UbiE